MQFIIKFTEFRESFQHQLYIHKIKSVFFIVNKKSASIIQMRFPKFIKNESKQKLPRYLQHPLPLLIIFGLQLSLQPGFSPIKQLHLSNQEFRQTVAMCHK